jgi:hypothetical protein
MACAVGGCCATFDSQQRQGRPLGHCKRPHAAAMLTHGTTTERCARGRRGPPHPSCGGVGGGQEIDEGLPTPQHGLDSTHPTQHCACLPGGGGEELRGGGWEAGEVQVQAGVGVAGVSLNVDGCSNPMAEVDVRKVSPTRPKSDIHALQPRHELHIRGETWGWQMLKRPPHPRHGLGGT